MGNAFHGAINMVINASDAPDFSNNWSMQHMFYNAKSMNQPIGHWDVSNVTYMYAVFRHAESFNQDISDWDVSNVNNMEWMFLNAKAFNRNISGWNVSKVVKMGLMFQGANSFNQNISSWDVSNVIDFSAMFSNCYEFNQPIGVWNTSSATNMKHMFAGATNFNQDISSWNVSNVTDMNSMFHYANNFNQDLSAWDFSNVTTMESMFKNTEVFNQNLSKWNITNVKKFDKFLNYSNMSVANYDSLLVGWSENNLQDSVMFSAWGCNYSPIGEKARQLIIDKFKWTIDDAGTFDYPPLFISDTTFTITENTVADIIDIDAIDGNGGTTDENIRYYIIDSLDNEYFSSASFNYDGFIRLSNKAGDFENPQDADSNNVYEFIVKAFDGLKYAQQHIAVTIIDTNEVPQLVSSSNYINFYENDTSLIYDFDANDGDYLVPDSNIIYVLSDTLDNGFFIVDSLNGKLKFKAQPDYEVRMDADSNNRFWIELSVLDEIHKVTKVLELILFDFNEPPYCISYDTVSISENSSGTIINIDSYDGDANDVDVNISYTLPDTLDNSFFTIEEWGGFIKLSEGLDYESAADRDSNNVYELYINISDGENITFHNLSMYLLNINEIPVFVSRQYIVIGEDTSTFVINVDANNGDGGESDEEITYRILPVDDYELFTINELSGDINFIVAPDYEKPLDYDSDNTYNIGIDASDGTLKSNQYLTIQVTDIEEAVSFKGYVVTDFVVYPNPVNNLVFIEYPYLAKVIIYDTYARKVKEGFTNKHLNIENLDEGKYIITINDKGKKLSKSIIKK